MNLAATLGELNRRVLLVDLDPQASASNWYGMTEEGKGLFEGFMESRDLKEPIQQTCVSRVEMIPSFSWLLGVDKAFVGEGGAEMILSRHYLSSPGTFSTPIGGGSCGMNVWEALSFRPLFHLIYNETKCQGMSCLLDS